MSGAAEAVAGLLGTPTGAARSLGGAWRVAVGDGRSVVAKHGAPGQARCEAAGLQWLRCTEGPPVPQVLAYDGEWLVIEDVGVGTVPGPDAAREFGRRVAALHRRGATAFGTVPDGAGDRAWIGTASMPTQTGPSWPQWYAEHRVAHYLRRAVDARAIGAADRRAVEAVCAGIDGLAGPAEPVARLHGDLWAGNMHLGADGRYWLLDPAAHGGHRETDLAMLALFGAPDLHVVIDGYQELAPLAPGWRERVPLHQLFPLLVHAVLFGGGYGRRAGDAAREALG